MFVFASFVLSLCIVLTLEDRFQFNDAPFPRLTSSARICVVKCVNGCIPTRPCLCDPNTVPFEKLTNKVKQCLKMTDWFTQHATILNTFNNKCGVSCDSFESIDAKYCKQKTPTQRSKFKIYEGYPLNDIQTPWALDLHTSIGRAMAVLIAPQYALTAGHNCITAEGGDESTSLSFAFGGSNDREKNEEQHRVAAVGKVVFHPTYFPYFQHKPANECNPHDPIKKCLDIAIVKFNKEIRRTTPVCLPTATEQLPTYYRVFGWGGSSNVSRTRILTYHSPYPVNTFTVQGHQPTCPNGHLCARATNINGATCKGDSGTGFIRRDGWPGHTQVDPDGFPKWRLMSILSHNYKSSPTAEDKCGRLPRLMLTVDVRPLLSWICSVAKVGC